MKVIVSKVVLENFKGEKHLEVVFGYLTFILGDNGLGKTRILDGIWWVLFGKDSKGRKNFELKSLDEHGNQIHGLTHSVRVTLVVDGEIVELERAIKEKWTKQKGKTDREFTGHVTTYGINGVPVSAINFTKRINEIINEETFKQITNVNYFTSLHWTEQRAVIAKLVGEVSVSDVIKDNSRLNMLIEPLRKMDVSDYMKYLSLERKKCNNELILIPPRIDECCKQIKEHNQEELVAERERILLEIKSFRESQKRINEDLMRRNSLRESFLKERERINLGIDNSPEGVLLNKERNVLEGINQKIRKGELEFEFCEKKVFELKSRVKYLEGTLKEQNEIRENLRKLFNVEIKKEFQFPNDDESCPTCLRPYDGDTINRLRLEGIKVFEEKKDKILFDINNEGKKVLARIDEVKSKLDGEFNELIDCEKGISLLKDRLNSLGCDREISKEKIKELEDKVKALKSQGSFNNYEIESNEKEALPIEFVEERGEVLETQLLEVNEKLNECKVNDELGARIVELQERIDFVSEEVAGIEGVEILCEEFIRDRARIIEKRFNSMFKGINFRLYKSQINGGLIECCEVTSGGVPFSNLNTGSQINCGLEIINALSRHYNISAPVFIDNRESVNNIVDVNSQLINFMVTKDESIVVEKYEEPKKKKSIIEGEKVRSIEF